MSGNELLEWKAMAHGFECKRCGYQEAAHDYPQDHPGICRSYVSPDKRAENKLWAIEREDESERQAMRRRKSGIADDL